MILACDEGRTGSLVCPRQVKDSAVLRIDDMILDLRLWGHDGSVGDACAELSFIPLPMCRTTGIPPPEKLVRKVDKVPSSVGLTSIIASHATR
jgi:hypothetical protein